MKRMLMAVGLLLTLFCAPIATAQTLSRHDQLSLQFAAGIWHDGRFESAIETAAMSTGMSFTNDPRFPQDWRPLIDEALLEELRARRPEIRLAFARIMGEPFTDAELELAVRVLNTPAGQRVFADREPGAPEPALTRAQERELDAAFNNPVGRSFLKKLEAADDVDFEAEGAKIGRTFAASSLLRIGAKLEAYEAQRQVPPPTEQEAAGIQFMNAFFDAMGYDKLTNAMVEPMREQGSVDASFPDEWKAIMIDVAVEQYAAQREGFVRLYAVHAAEVFTADELRFGVAWFSTEGVRARVAAAAAKLPEPTPTRAQQKEMDKLARQRPAAGFFAKLQTFSVVPADEGAVVRLLFPKLMRIAGQRIQALESRQPVS